VAGNGRRHLLQVGMGPFQNRPGSWRPLGPCRLGRLRVRGWHLSGQDLQLFLGNRSQFLRYLQQTRPAMGSLGRVVALAGPGPVELDDPRRVKYGPVDLDVVVVESIAQGVQDSLDQSAVIGGEVDGVDEMKTVARIAEHGLGPAKPAE